MRRREIIASIGAAAVGWPLAARGQQPARQPVVGFVLATAAQAQMMGADPEFPVARAFVHAMRDLGWSDGRNVVIVRRSAEGDPARATAVLAELVARGVDVFAMGGAAWLLDAARQVARDFPIVAAFSDDPVAAGIVASLGRPGGNITGLVTVTGLPELVAKRLQFLRELVPGARRIAFLGPRSVWEPYRATVGEADIVQVFAEVNRPDEYADALAVITRERAEALVVLGGPITYFHLPRIVAFAAEQRLPAIYNSPEAGELGGLMSYGASVSDLFRQLAALVDKVLRGARPADLPIEQPTRLSLLINLRTATALGISVAPSLLLRADEVIE